MATEETKKPTLVVDDEILNGIRPCVDVKRPKWDRCDVTYKGSDDVKAAGYPRVPSGVDQADVEGYRQRAWFRPSMRGNVILSRGQAFRKDVVTTGAERMFDAVTSNFDGAGTSLPAFARDLVTGLLVPGRQALSLDFSASRRAPYATLYKDPGAIEDWDFGEVDGTRQLVLVKIGVWVDDPSKRHNLAEQKVVFTLDPKLGLIVQLYRRSPGLAGWPVVQEFRPTRRGQPVRFVPVVPVNATGLDVEPDEPPLLDLVDTNLAHLQNSADYEQGLFYLVPTLVVTGAKVDGKLQLGLSSGLNFEEPNAKAQLLEFSGTGLGNSVAAMKQKEEAMLGLGARFFDTQRRGMETAEAVKLRQGADHATLADIVESASEALTKVSRWGAWWMGLTDDVNDEEISVSINRDFDISRMSPDEQRALILGYQAGLVSKKTYVHNMHGGEMLPHSPEEELALLEAESLDSRSTLVDDLDEDAA